MRKNAIYTVLLAVCVGCATHTGDEDMQKADFTLAQATIVTELPRLSAEEMPEFPGGSTALMTYLIESMHYPKDAEDAQKEGRVICSFVVSKEGKINDAHVVKSSGTESLDAEALRIINAMPDWKPGAEDGEPVNVQFTLPISFKLK